MHFLRQDILVASGGVKTKKWFNSKVLDLYDNEILIAWPMLKGEAMAAGENQPLEVSFSQGNARYLYHTTVRQVFAQEALAMEQPRQVQKTDFRKYPRTAVDLQVLYTEKGPAAAPGQKSGSLLDISGSGLRMATEHIYSPGTPISLSFSLPGGDQELAVEIEARVVRIVVADDLKDPVEYHLGLEYTSVDRKIQEMIIKYVNGRLGRI